MDADGFTLVVRKSRRKKCRNKANCRSLSDSNTLHSGGVGQTVKRNLPYGGKTNERPSAPCTNEKNSEPIDTAVLSALSQRLKHFQLILKASPLYLEIRECLATEMCHLLKRSRVGKPLNIHITAYGIGNFEISSSSQFQLALTNLIHCNLLEIATAHSKSDLQHHCYLETSLTTEAISPPHCTKYAKASIQKFSEVDTKTAQKVGTYFVKNEKSAKKKCQHSELGRPKISQVETCDVNVVLHYFDPTTSAIETHYLQEYTQFQFLSQGNDCGRRPLDSSAGMFE